MKRIIFPFLGVLMLVFSGCNNDKGDELERFIGVPAVVGYNSSIGYILITHDETFLAPDLADYHYYGYFDIEDAILANFIINHSRQPSKDYRTVTNFQLSMWLDKVKPEESESGDPDDYEPVESIGFFPIIMYDMIHVLFVACYHKDTYYRDFDYEMIYDAGDTSSSPVLYLMAKKNKDSQKGTKDEFLWPGAFDMSDYLMTLDRDSKNEVHLNVKFQGKDEDGNVVWKDYSDKPVTITFKEDD